MSVIVWEYPKELYETDFALTYALGGGARLLSVDYDELAEAVIVEFEVDSGDVDKIPDSDHTGTLLSIG
jgi:hypothetical protein